ncbi:hypothetical protein [Streptomyces zagrosensis]|uniref:Uncharacterized protein n=1 Tax=Streptomyces zagrosensis TaxID=1042984 RepID=A0A7W9QGY8_9ACTN|nr:hypothetical protein [Streptomyces zagrosensis]MBB5940073.1 hypothetical protein [Streptomyces zagrosensis]
MSETTSEPLPTPVVLTPEQLTQLADTLARHLATHLARRDPEPVGVAGPISSSGDRNSSSIPLLVPAAAAYGPDR